MPEIIYPSIIIVSLSTIFYLFWKKAYQIETNETKVGDSCRVLGKQTDEDFSPGEFSDFWSNQETVQESEESVSTVLESSVQISEAMK
jgi:hypothetical protein